MKQKRTPMGGGRHALPAVIAVLLAVTAFAVISITADDGSDAAVGDYNAGDIAVINSIIDNNGLVWTKATGVQLDGDGVPGDWWGVTWSGDPSDQRIIELEILWEGLNGSLDVSGLTALKKLDCQSNNLTSLNVSNLTALKYLSCGSNNLTSLDVSSLTALEYLYYPNNNLISIDISKLTVLKELVCANNDMKSLDVSKLTALEYLDCAYNDLKSLDVSKLTALEELDCRGNYITSLNVSKLAALKNLVCFGNYITSLNVSGCTALENLGCSENRLTSLDVSSLTALKILNCSYNSLTSLDVSKLTALEYLGCENNDLKSLDVSNLAALESLYCTYNSLTSLSISNLTALKYLVCYNNNLTSLSLSNLAALKYLDCSYNSLTTLGVSGFTALEYLYCNMNELTDLDVDGIPILYIDCRHNIMTDLSKVTNAGAVLALDFTPQRGLVTISNSDTVAQVKDKIDVVIAAGKVPLVKGSKTNATEKLTLDMNGNNIYWDADYAGNALELVNDNDFIIGKGATVTLTGLETEIEYITVYGTLNVNGNVSATDTWFEAELGGILTVNGNIAFDGTEYYGIGSDGGKINVTGNVTDDGNYDPEWYLVEVFHKKGVVFIGGSIITSGIAIGAWEGNVTVNGNVVADGIYAIECTYDSIVHVKGNVSATGVAVVMDDMGIVKIDGKIAQYGDYIMEYGSWNVYGEGDFTSKNTGGYNFLYSYNGWSVYIGLSPAGGSYTINSSASGGATISPSGITSVEKGGSRTFTFSASTVKVDGVELSPVEVAKGSYTFSNVVSSHTIVASGTPPKPVYSLDITIIGGKGNVKYSVNSSTFSDYVQGISIQEGSKLVLKAFADKGFSFVEWKIDGETIDTIELTIDSVNGPITITLYLEEGTGGEFQWTYVWILLIILLILIVVAFVVVSKKKK